MSTSWHIPNPDPTSPVPGRIAQIMRSPRVSPAARAAAVRAGRRNLQREFEQLAKAKGRTDCRSPFGSDTSPKEKP